MHESKFEIKFDEETKGLKELCEKLERRAVNWFDDIKNADVEEAGEVIDMIKDLCEAKEKVAKTCYYKSIVKAMEKSDEDEEKYREFEERMMKSAPDEWGRMGYRGREANGRFVHRAGRGRNAGYTPYTFMDEEMMDDEYGYPDFMNYRMGYSDGRNGNYSDGRSGNYGGQSDGQSYGYSRGERSDGRTDGRNEGYRYGRSYSNYRTARRHYTESQSPEEQKKMKESIAEVFDDMEDITVDMVKDMSQEEKQKYRKKLQDMMQKIQ